MTPRGGGVALLRSSGRGPRTADGFTGVTPAQRHRIRRGRRPPGEGLGGGACSGVLGYSSRDAASVPEAVRAPNSSRRSGDPSWGFRPLFWWGKCSSRGHLAHEQADPGNAAPRIRRSPDSSLPGRESHVGRSRGGNRT
jgi:hypothetical protein